MSTPQRRGLGRGLELLVGGGGRAAGARADPRRRHRAERAPAAPALRAGGDGRARRVDPQAGAAAAGRRSAAAGRRLRADRRRATVARRARSGHRGSAGARARGGRSRLAAARARRERRAGAALGGRGGARVRGAARRVRPVARRARASASAARSRRCRTGCGCSSCRTRCSGCSPAASSPKVMRGPCSRFRTNDERVRLARRIVRGGLSVRAAERAAQAAGAKRKRAREPDRPRRSPRGSRRPRRALTGMARTGDERQARDRVRGRDGARGARRGARAPSRRARIPSASASTSADSTMSAQGIPTPRNASGFPTAVRSQPRNSASTNVTPARLAFASEQPENAALSNRAS